MCFIYKMLLACVRPVSQYIVHILCVPPFSGNLKHKDLQGREVASQMYPEDDEEDDEEEPQEEEPDSDETVDEEVALAEEDGI